MSIVKTLMVLLLAFALCLQANDVGPESRRTVIMGLEQDLSERWSALTSPDAQEPLRVQIDLVRSGRDKLIEVPASGGLVYHNARDLALEAIFKNPPEDSARAQRALERAGDDLQRHEKILERYPQSVQAIASFQKLLDGPEAFRIRYEWSKFFKRIKDADTSRSAPMTDITYPASETHAEHLRMPPVVTGDLVLRGSIFRRRSQRIGPHGDVREMPKFPQSYASLGRNDLVLSDYRGLIRFRFGKTTENHFYEAPYKLLEHLDNNIIGDFTRIGDVIVTSQRSTPQLRDSQKNLYVVELSRQKLMGFQLDANLEDHPRFEQTRIWSPLWEVTDDKKTFNSPVSARGTMALTTATSLSGLFNVDLVAVDVKTGRQIWNRPLASGQQELNYFGRHIREAVGGTPLPTQDHIYVCSNFGTVHCVDPVGRPVWTSRYQRIPTPVPIQYYAMVQPRLSRFRNQMPQTSEDQLYCSPTDSDALLCFDRHTGKHLWSHNLNPQIKKKSYPHDQSWRKAFWFLTDDAVVLFDNNKLTRLDLKSGRVLKVRELDRRYLYLGRPLLTADGLLLACSNKLHLINVKTLDSAAFTDLSELGIHFKQANLAFDGSRVVFTDTDGNLQILNLGDDS